MALQLLCLLFFVTHSLAASTAGRKWCSGGLLRGFLENGEEGCCIPEGLCHNPAQARILAEQLQHIGKPNTRRKRSLDNSGFHMRDYLSKKETTTEKHEGDDDAATLLGPAAFQEKPSEKQKTCPAGCSRGKINLCTVETKLSFPVFGMSVTTKKKVHIIQAEPMFDQPVVRRLCKQKTCALLQGKCSQVYQPQLMFVNPGTAGAARMDLDYVYVESGCEASIDLAGGNDSSDSSSSSMDTSEFSDALEIGGDEGNLGVAAVPEVHAEEHREDESPAHASAPEPEAEATTHTAPVELHADTVVVEAVIPEEEHEVVVMGETTVAPVPDSLDHSAESTDHAADAVDHDTDSMDHAADTMDHDADSVGHATDDHAADDHAADVDHAADEDHAADVDQATDDHAADVDPALENMEAANLEGSEEVGSSTTTIHP